MKITQVEIRHTNKHLKTQVTFVRGAEFPYRSTSYYPGRKSARRLSIALRGRAPESRGWHTGGVYMHFPVREGKPA